MLPELDKADYTNAERRALLSARMRLIDKKYDGRGLNRSDEVLLQRIRWALDRIEDAEIRRRLRAVAEAGSGK